MATRTHSARIATVAIRLISRKSPRSLPTASAVPDGRRIAYHKSYQVFLADAMARTPCKLKRASRLICADLVAGSDMGAVCLRRALQLPSTRGSCRWVGRAQAGRSWRIPRCDRVSGRAGFSRWQQRRAGLVGRWWSGVLHGPSRFQRGAVSHLTRWPERTTHPHAAGSRCTITRSPRPRRVAYLRLAGDGVRQLFMLCLADRSERQITDLSAGRAAMWPHWQPTAKP